MTRSSKKTSRARRQTPLAMLAAPLCLLTAVAPSAAEASVATTTLAYSPAWTLAAMASPNRVDGLAVEELDDGTTILRLKGTTKPTFNVYRLEDPQRLVVDIAASERGAVVPHIPLDTWAAGRVTVDGVAERDTKLVRVVVELKREVSYIVVPDGGELVVTITPRELPPEAYFARKSAGDRRKEIEADRVQATRMRKDASALEAKASTKVREAERKAKAAAADASHARKAAKEARAAESRAKAAEAKAAAELKDAKSNRFAARRVLRVARAEREKLAEQRAAADKQLVAAQKQAKLKRKAAQSTLAAAEAVAKKRLADAAKTKKQAQRELASAKSTRANADAEAKRTLASASSTKAEAAAALAAAKKEAKQRKAEAAAELAAAKKSAAAAEKTAKRRLDTARAEAERARKDAAKATTDAKRFAAAEAAKAKKVTSSADAAAKKKLADAEARAEAKLAKAERELSAAKKAASTAQAHADARLAQARSDLATAQSKAKRAEATAKEQLAAAAKERSQARKDAAAIVASAELAAAKKLAAAEKTAAASSKKELEKARARADRLVANAKLEAAKLTRTRIDAAEREAKATVARAETKARAAARKKLESAEREAEQRLKKAKKKAKASSIAAAEKELAKVRKEGDAYVAAAASKARKDAQSGADAKLAAARKKIEAEAAEQIRVARAAAAKTERAASAKLAAADSKLRDADSKLEDAEAQRRSALTLRKDAAAALATAEKAKKRAEEDRRAAVAARKRAETALADAKERASVDAKKRGRVSKKAKTAVAAAQKARDAASAREAKAAKRLGSLQSERDDLRAKLDARDAKLVAMQGRLDAAEAAAARSAAEAETAKRGAAVIAKRNSEAASTQPKPKPEPKAKRRAKAKRGKPAANVADVRFESDASEERIIVKFEGPVAYDGMTLTPTIQMLKFKQASLAKKLERSLDATSYKGPIKVITSFAEGDDAKVVVSTVGPVRPRLEEKAGEVVWHFPRSKGGPVAKTEAVSMAGTKVGGFASAPRPAAQIAAPRSGQADVTEGRRSRRGRWRGERIDIELQDAPIKDVLLLFSDIGRVNIVAGNGVEGAVTMKLNSVPWDQALDIILRSLSLGSTREGNVIRVATLTDLEEERKKAIERANARVQLKPLETRLVSVSYATVDEMIPKVQTVLSPRGTVTPDARTNKLIIMDVSENIALAEDLIRSLDTQTPQVLIEARIVEARTNFTRQLGIQWGFDYTASPGTGNPTGLLFPNSIGVGGGGTGTPIDSRGLVLPGAAANPNYAVDLPAPVGTGAGGAVGFSFGSISGNLNTNLRLSAAESTGEVRIISAPKIVTLDNSEATIEQGVQIPISQVSAQGVNTRFVNAALSLEVTPHVTNEGAVLLDVTVQKNEADFINTGARGDPTILTKQAQSRMLVNDNDTAVIGGIYTRNKAVNYTKIPWLGDIPIIGWFFKNKSEADTRSEVLIFLTPKIVNRAGSIGG